MLADARLVPPGDYLVIVRRAPIDADEARRWLITALSSLLPSRPQADGPDAELA